MSTKKITFCLVALIAWGILGQAGLVPDLGFTKFVYFILSIIS